jgi:hypothetical protein
MMVGKGKACMLVVVGQLELGDDWVRLDIYAERRRQVPLTEIRRTTNVEEGIAGTIEFIQGLGRQPPASVLTPHKP